MPKEAKIFRFGKGGIPKGLEKRIKIPSHIKREGHPLKPYVDESIIPSDLDLIVLEDLDSLYRKFSNSDFFTLSVGGMYIAENHIWTDNEVYERMNQLLEEEYGIHTKRALLLPQQISYWSMIHEGLHDVFNNLPQDKRKKIISSAVKNYDNIDKLSDMLELTHLDISSFKWDIGEIGRRMEKNKKEKKSPLDCFEDFYTLGNLKSDDKMVAVDEFISSFFTNDRVENRWDERYLPRQFKETLRDAGYNMNNPPARKKCYHGNYSGISL